MTAKAALAVSLVCGLMGAAEPVAAQGFFFWSDPPPRPRERVYRRDEYGRPRPRPASNRVPNGKDAAADAAVVKPVVHPGSALVAVVSIKSQSITIWDQTGPILRSKVSTGQSGHATPTGLFSVIQKNRYHESNIYSGAPMPWMHRITWSGIALHAGVVPNYPASHGCIRLPYDFAPKLWAISRMGMRVVVAPSDTEVTFVDDPALPVPVMQSADEVLALLRSIHGGIVSPNIVPASEVPDKRYNPAEVAAFMRKQAALAVDASKVVAKEALAASAQASAEANAAIAEARTARAMLQAAEAEARSAAQTADAATGTQEQVERAAAKIAADAKVAEARQRFTLAAAAEAEKDPPAFELARAAREAEKRAEEAPDLLKATTRRQEPVSIFVSRKEKRVFMRQGFEPLLDAPVEIEDAVTPLGTHVFTAMGPSEDGRRLQWSTVTTPSHEAHGSALDALKRVKLPADVKSEMEKRVWTGASLIISDFGISNETGKGTDFVILTK